MLTVDGCRSATSLAETDEALLFGKQMRWDGMGCTRVVHLFVSSHFEVPLQCWYCIWRWCWGWRNRGAVFIMYCACCVPRSPAAHQLSVVGSGSADDLRLTADSGEEGRRRLLIVAIIGPDLP